MSVNCRRVLLSVILLWAVGGTTFANVVAGDPPTEQTTQKSPSQSERSEQHRRWVVAVAFFALGGILFVGLTLIALTVLWGVRTRRIARKPPPDQSPDNPLWYLRPNKQSDEPDTAPSVDPAETDSQQDTDETI